MEHIWAPWRVEYIFSEKPESCILCDKPNENKDEENYVLYHGKHNYVILNKYPYNPAHLLIAPYRHIDSLEHLTDEERNEHFELVSRCLGVLRKVFNPHGFNIGANIGRTAGAGIDEHYHSHIIPRWNGDTNYVTIMDDVRVIPQAMAETYQQLKGKF
jgi:ATP adenylyltransferase